MDVAGQLAELLAILAFAKLGAELAERVRVPAVIGEIVAGLVLGPSLLGWVHPGETVELLAQVGVILLLLQVGMEMDLREMRRVGASALAVGVIGVVVPFAMGWAVAGAFGHDGNTALFMGAALAATSVGITARTFGDLRMLGTVEARVVLGAAVIDDVLGLVVLTVVLRLTREGGVELLDTLGLLIVAVGFLVVATAAASLLAPPLFAWIQRSARSTGTLLVAALVFTLALALAAHAVDLAVIIGAFVAGLALGRTRQSERIERDLNPLAGFFVPIFFVSVGLALDLSTMANAEVLVFATALLSVALAGKLVAGLGVRREGIDRLLVGLGMVPRGEVGLIFASVGLASGVLDEGLYGALLAVVLVTTVITPPSIRARAGSRRGDVPADGTEAAAARSREVPGLETALRAARGAPGHPLTDEVTDQMAEVAAGSPVWSEGARAELVQVLSQGSREPWRVLDATGVLAAALPHLADELDHRRHDASLLDPAHLLRLPVVEALASLIGPDGDRRAAEVAGELESTDLLWYAALALDLAADIEDPGDAARALCDDIATTPQEAAEVAAAALGASLLRQDAQHLAPDPMAGSPDLRQRLGSADQARRAYLLGLALGELDGADRAAYEELFTSLVSGVEP